jgi:hypothetical protein
MITDEQILELAEKHLEVLVDDYEGIEYFSSTKKQMVEFVRAIYEMGYEQSAMNNGGYF